MEWLGLGLGLCHTVILLFMFTERPYKCNLPDRDDDTKECGERFYKKQDVLDHQKTFHEGGKLKCPVEGCGRTFKNAMGIRNHKRMEHDRNPRYHCDRCSREPGDPNYWKGTMMLGDYVTHLVKVHSEDEDRHPDSRKYVKVQTCKNPNCRKMTFSECIAVYLPFTCRLLTVYVPFSFTCRLLAVYLPFTCRLLTVLCIYLQVLNS